MNATVKKFITASVAALSIGATIALTAAPAEAKWGRRGHFAGAIAAGLVGAAIIGTHGHHYGHRVACWHDKRPFYDRWGNFIGYRYVRVCE